MELEREKLHSSPLFRTIAIRSLLLQTPEPLGGELITSKKYGPFWRVLLHEILQRNQKESEKEEKKNTQGGGEERGLTAK